MDCLSRSNTSNFVEWIESIRIMFVAGAVSALGVFAPVGRLEAIHVYPTVDRRRPWLWLVFTILCAGLLPEVGSGRGFVFGRAIKRSKSLEVRGGRGRESTTRLAGSTVSRDSSTKVLKFITAAYW